MTYNEIFTFLYIDNFSFIRIYRRLQNKHNLIYLLMNYCFFYKKSMYRSQILYCNERKKLKTNKYLGAIENNPKDKTIIFYDTKRTTYMQKGKYLREIVLKE